VDAARTTLRGCSLLIKPTVLAAGSVDLFLGLRSRQLPLDKGWVQRGRLRFKWLNTEPRDSPNEPQLAH